MSELGGCPLSSGFFASPSLRSQIKSLVVGEYYRQWGHIIGNALGPRGDAMGYVDLFCGPGTYDDGTESTPLVVLRETLRSAMLRSRIRLVFNDQVRTRVRRLEGAVDSVLQDDGRTLVRSPEFSSFEVGKGTLQWFTQLHLGACLFFLDPWGYRGLSMDLISGFVQGWGSDCIFLFNYAALRRHLFNEGEDELVAEFWNAEDLESLRVILSGASPDDSENRAVNFLRSCLQSRGVPYVLPMRFTVEDSDRTSYHLVLASKNFRAYELMKEVMRRVCTGRKETIVPFEFSVRHGPRQLELLPAALPEDDLSERLFEEFVGESLKFRDLYRSFEGRHTTPFIKRDYVAALDTLRGQQLVSGGRRGGIGDDTEVQFTSQSERERLRSKPSQPSLL